MEPAVSVLKVANEGRRLFRNAGTYPPNHIVSCHCSKNYTSYTLKFFFSWIWTICPAVRSQDKLFWDHVSHEQEAALNFRVKRGEKYILVGLTSTKICLSNCWQGSQRRLKHCPYNRACIFGNFWPWQHVNWHTWMKVCLELFSTRQGCVLVRAEPTLSSGLL
jgi:hypothetical protein